MSKMVSMSAARKLLKQNEKQISNDQMIVLIEQLHLLAREQLRYNGSKEGTNEQMKGIVKDEEGIGLRPDIK